MVMWLYTVLGASLSMWVVLGIYVFSEIKKVYDKEEIFTNKLLIAWYTMWTFHHIPVALASFFAIWLIPVNRALALICGLIIFVVGAVILPLGMIEFRSLRRSTGQDVSKLITTGIYRWSRNPQFIGWFFLLLGISIAGRSGFALALTAGFMIVLHLFTVTLAEPYLEHLYGEEYRLYKSNTPRYIGIPKELG